MKHPAKCFVVFCFLLLALLSGRSTAQAQTTVTFDALAPGNDYLVIPNGYGNLQWYNFGAYNGANRPAREGYHTGTISPNNVAFNLVGYPASIQSSSKFDLNSAYLTAAFVTNLQVVVQGFIGPDLIYSNSYTLTPAAPAFIQFNYAGVDHVTFTPSPESPFVMDNLTITPELTTPSSGFAIAPTDGVHDYGMETGVVNVTASPGSAWTVSTGLPWITILSSSANIGNGTVLYQVQSNSTGFPRNGFINIAGQLYAVSQSPYQPMNAAPVDLGNIQVAQIGHSFWTNVPGRRAPYANLVRDYLIDQSQNSGGGSVLQPVTVDWNTNHQFTLTVSAPAGKMFLLQVPPGGVSAKFGGSLWWESSGGGSSPPGTVQVSFGGLQGGSPDFSQSFSVLSDSHGYFGFGNIDSAPFTKPISFTSIIITGTAAPQYAGGGALLFTPHHESSLLVTCAALGPDDPGPVLSIVPQSGLVPSGVIPVPTINATLDENGDLTLSFTGALQSSSAPGGPFSDVVGHPLGTFFIPKSDQGSRQFFRAKDNY